MRVIFFGDVFGKAGRLSLIQQLPVIKEEYKPDFVLINAENLADGKGLTEKTLKPLFKLGVDAVTGGNHLWDRMESLDYIRKSANIVKPMNYPAFAPGSSHHTIKKQDMQLTVINLCGQVYMPPCDSPFSTFDDWLEAFTESEPCIILDFHAESTAEKRALGWHVDGKISALMGTHTHIQTADEEILPQGTAYITDVGMTGPHDSVIGMRKSIILEKMTTGIPIRYESSDQGNQINAVCVDIDPTTKQTMKIIRIKQQIKLQEPL